MGKILELYFNLTDAAKPDIRQDRVHLVQPALQLRDLLIHFLPNILDIGLDPGFYLPQLALQALELILHPAQLQEGRNDIFQDHVHLGLCRALPRQL